MKDRINVIYIGGSGRSGSTVLTKLLNYWDGLIGLNEICYLWEYGIEGNHPVSDGDLFSESDFWKQVLGAVFPNRPISRPQADFFAYPSQVGLKNLLLNRWRARPQDGSVRAYAKTVELLYAQVLAVSGDRYVVDSSKTPDYAYFLSRIKTFDILLIHLIRDPRAVVYSWSKQFKRQDTREGTDVAMTRFGLLKSTLRWMKWNLGCELLRGKKNVRYLRVRYEDFAKNPDGVLDRISAMLELPSSPPRYHRTEEGFQDQHHARDISIWGNPKVRTKKGAIQVSEDNEWVDNLSLRKKLMTTLLTLPLLVRYGYRLYK